MYLSGLVEGNQIELARHTSLSDGMTILVKIQLPKLSDVWKNDSNLSQIFATQ